MEEYANRITLDGYGFSIKEGRHVKTPSGEYMELKHGHHYTILGGNMHSRKCELEVKIDPLAPWVCGGIR